LSDIHKYLRQNTSCESFVANGRTDELTSEKYLTNG